MFDVVWTDPDRETVGHRRARKEREQKAKDKGKGKEKEAPTNASRRSISTRSTRSSLSSADSTFAFFKARSLKQAKSSTSSPISQSIFSSQSPRSQTFDSSSHRSSALLADVSEVHSEPVQSRRRYSHMDKVSVSASDTTDLSQDQKTHASIDSVFSASLEAEVTASASTSPSKSIFPETKTTHLIQTLGPDSYITQVTEVSWESRAPDTDVPHLMTEVTILADPVKDHPRSSPAPAPPPSLLGNSSIVHLSAPSITILVPLCPTSSSSSAAVSFQPNSVDAWRPPEDWDCTPPEERATGNAAQVEQLPRSGPVDQGLESGLDLATLCREVQRMAAANPDIVLSRLKEVPSAIADEGLQQEPELEKKRWMLSALHHLDPLTDIDGSRPPGNKIPMGTARKVLALYESQVTASYLAALYPDKQLYHMSPTPLPHSSFPNSHPIFVPSVSPFIFPTAPGLFEAVYSLSLPALCSSSDIPRILKNAHRCLKPGGTLQLAIIDPLPCAGTLGDTMRAWLDEHLLLNLEKQFRCLNPSRAFPHWMAEASLRGQGSTRTTAKFFATPENATSQEEDPDPSIRKANSESRTKAQVRSLVGRLLWTEVWGPYVTADCWWWEDPACVQECRELGTFWEYNLIEGVRDN